MASMEGDEDDVVDPLEMLLLEDEVDGGRKSFDKVLNGVSKQQVDQRLHHIRSIGSALLIRQLPSRGLSFQLWPAATTLVKLLDDLRLDPTRSPLARALLAGRDPATRLKILELGSGTGLVGIAAASTLAAEVTLTDLPHVVPNLQFNAEANADLVESHGGRVEVAALEWGKGDDLARVGKDMDVVLASDVVYHDHLYDPLLKTLRFLLGAAGGNCERTVFFVMAHLRRWKKEAVFFKKARRLFKVEVLHVDKEPPQGSRTAVTVYSFVGKNKRI